MIWLSIILAVIQLVVKLPDIAETLRKIIEIFKSKGPLRAAREASNLLDAIQSKLRQIETPEIASMTCPLASYADELDKRWSTIA